MQNLEKQSGDFRLHPSSTKEIKEGFLPSVSSDGRIKMKDLLFKRQNEIRKEAGRPGNTCENSGDKEKLRVGGVLATEAAWRQLCLGCRFLTSHSPMPSTQH